MILPSTSARKTTSRSPESRFRPARRLSFDGGTFTLPSAIKMGHKFAVVPIKEGDAIQQVRPDHRLRRAERRPGEHVHVHNVKLGVVRTRLRLRHRTFRPRCRRRRNTARSWATTAAPARPTTSGTAPRNYLAVISTVNCSASTSKYIADRVRALGLLKDYPNVDGVIAIVHRQGCGMQFDGPDHQQLGPHPGGFRHATRTWRAYLLVGLGCEIVQASHLIEQAELNLIQLDGKRGTAVGVSIQECGGIGKTVEAGVKAVTEMLPRVNDVQRVQLPAKHLILGTNCGGSDGNSGA